jgi:hypothetical protein
MWGLWALLLCHLLFAFDRFQENVYSQSNGWGKYWKKLFHIHAIGKQILRWTVNEMSILKKRYC